MAETTDILSDDDITEIGSVLKLAPHARSSQFENVQKSSEGETLISLDELYEKTGQESINTIVDGFKQLTKNKLSRAHGLALNIKGAESWLPTPDRLNAIRGGEGFFSTLKDGIVTIVKAIIKFVSGIYNWIVERLRRLFGLDKTMKEVEFLNESSVELNSKTANLVNALGGSNVYSPEEFCNTLDTGAIPEQQLMVVRNRLLSQEETFKRIADSMPAFKEAIDMIGKFSDAADKASTRYHRASDDLRRKFKNGTTSDGDLREFSYMMTNEIVNGLNHENLYNVIELLYKGFYDIEITGLGIDTSINDARAKIKNALETVKLKLDPKGVSDLAAARRKLTEMLNKVGANGKTKFDIRLKPETMKKFSEIPNQSDAEMFRDIAAHLGGKVPSAELLPEQYVQLTTSIRDYVSTVELLLGVIKDIERTYMSITQWYSRLSTAMAVYVTGDAKKIAELKAAMLSPEEQERLKASGNDISNVDMEESFDKRYPGWRAEEGTSRIMRSIQEVEQVAKPLNRFVATMKG